LQEPHITGYYRMTKTELPPKLPNHYEDITNKLNNHELVRNIYFVLRVLSKYVCSERISFDTWFTGEDRPR